MSIQKVKSFIKQFLVKALIKENVWYKQRFLYCDKFWNRFHFNLQVVNLGSNTGLYGFRYDKLQVNAANWALSPQSFNQDLAILKTYYSYVGPKGTILVPLCPYSSCLKNYTDTKLMKYYTILHPGVIDDFDIVKQQEAYKIKDYPYVYYRKHMLIGLLLTLKKKFSGYKEPLSYDYCPLTSEQIEANAQMFIDGWMRQFKIDNMSAQRPPHIEEGRKVRVSTLKEMWTFCLERNLKMYVVLPPVTKSLSNKFSKEFRENYIYSFLREAEIPSENFLDYLDDSNLQRDEYFYNSLFLNKKGGEIFTERVLKDIKLI
jgi:hypothetical protein